MGYPVFIFGKDCAVKARVSARSEGVASGGEKGEARTLQGVRRGIGVHGSGVGTAVIRYPRVEKGRREGRDMTQAKSARIE